MKNGSLVGCSDWHARMLSISGHHNVYSSLEGGDLHVMISLVRPLQKVKLKNIYKVV